MCTHSYISKWSCTSAWLRWVCQRRNGQPRSKWLALPWPTTRGERRNENNIVGKITRPELWTLTPYMCQVSNNYCAAPHLWPRAWPIKWTLNLKHVRIWLTMRCGADHLCVADHCWEGLTIAAGCWQWSEKKMYVLPMMKRELKKALWWRNG